MYEEGILLEYHQNGDLETYMKDNAEPATPYRTGWILSLIKTIAISTARVHWLMILL
jgi:hypothetical protein